jgi:hypothetical protein
MTARHPDSIAFPPQFLSVEAVDVSWRRKTFALALHMTCLGLFGVLVVWPVVSPIASGELAREFEPLLRAWASWSSKLLSLRP